MLSEIHVAIDCVDVEAQADFWAAALGYRRHGQADQYRSLMPDSDTAPSDATHAGMHSADLAYDDGGCGKGIMADCCVMTCCSATMPDLVPGAVPQFVIAARSSRPTVAGGRVIVPLLEPPKRLS